jgi:hypothetical protein
VDVAVAAALPVTVNEPAPATALLMNVSVASLPSKLVKIELVAVTRLFVTTTEVPAAANAALPLGELFVTFPGVPVEST